MSEFQLSLLTIGLIVVVGVYLYGYWQQWRYRRSLGEASKSLPKDASVSYESNNASSRSSLPDDERNTLSGIDGDHSSSSADGSCGLLNDATDYVVTFLLKTPKTPEALENLWQRRFDFGKSIHACGLNTVSGLWERLIPESELTYRAFRLGLQLVDRSGSVSQMRLAGFHDLLSD